MKKLVFTQHANDAIAERELDLAWIEAAVRNPDWTALDPKRPAIERRFRMIPQHGSRVLRVACYETDVEIRIVTVFFDRDARKPQ